MTLMSVTFAQAETSPAYEAVNLQREFDGAEGKTDKHGVTLTQRKSVVTDTKKHEAYYLCRDERTENLVGVTRAGQYGYTDCQRVPEQVSVTKKVTNTYEITDRDRYVDHRGKQGMVAGGIIGGTLGLMAGSALWSTTGSILMTAFMGGFIGAMLLGGIMVALAQNKSETFTETYTQTETK